ncbi:protein serine/threonine phosphatase 2C [Cytidiella melzeri]|nr:protein serine/threonine phosphatase 2C [Cytidiella melzeri]
MRPAQPWNTLRQVHRAKQCPQLPLNSCSRIHSRPMSSLPRPYRFHIGASWAGKAVDPRGRQLNTKPLGKDHPVAIWREHVLSRPNGGGGKHIGEDFFYIQEMRNQSGISLGIADGVGGWIDSGVDPSLFSQTLMYHAHRYAQQGWVGEPEIDPTQDYAEREQVEGWELTPMECMSLAHGGVLRERSVVAGSSTACIVNLNASTGSLRAANLGDSGFCIIRSSSVIHFQAPQTHYFNCPRQLTKIPFNARLFGGVCNDSATDADTHETKLIDGDIVILFTDGLSDNVFPSELISICSLVSRQYAHSPPPLTPAGDSSKQDYKFIRTEEDAQVQTIAERIVNYAQLCMNNKKRVTPFERAAAREGMYFRGGKIDDVTVIAAMVRETL